MHRYKHLGGASARKRVVAFIGAMLVVACGSAAPGPVGTPLNVYELKFRVMDAVGTPVYCDPDFYPVAREGGEQTNAIAAYPTIRAQADLYAAIVAYEHLSSSDLNDSQKLTVYRGYKLLNALVLSQNGNEYGFEFRARSKDQSTIQLVKGTVRVDGVVTVASRTDSGPLPCPICLAAATLIATPSGPVRVVDIKTGTLVWTADRAGRRVVASVLEVGSTWVPAGHMMVHLVLADGRELLASPGHRTSDGRALGSLAAGDPLDGSTIKVWELVPYAGDRTYDLLPEGATGAYWANGILLSSTLAPTST
jgi:outer membrane protein assembly factor BamB